MAQTSARISSLTQYPIKSCGGMTLERAEIDESGLRGDRPLFLIDGNGDALGQEELPRMALIKREHRRRGSRRSSASGSVIRSKLRVVDQGESRHDEALGGRGTSDRSR